MVGHTSHCGMICVVQLRNSTHGMRLVLKICVDTRDIEYYYIEELPTLNILNIMKPPKKFNYSSNTDLEVLAKYSVNYTCCHDSRFVELC